MEQWQLIIIVNGPSISYFKVPQRHEPVMLIAVLPYPATLPLRARMLMLRPRYRNGCCSTVGASVEVRVPVQPAINQAGTATGWGEQRDDAACDQLAAHSSHWSVRSPLRGVHVPGAAA